MPDSSRRAAVIRSGTSVATRCKVNDRRLRPDKHHVRARVALSTCLIVMPMLTFVAKRSVSPTEVPFGLNQRHFGLQWSPTRHTSARV